MEQDSDKLKANTSTSTYSTTASTEINNNNNKYNNNSSSSTSVGGVAASSTNDPDPKTPPISSGLPTPLPSGNIYHEVESRKRTRLEAEGGEDGIQGMKKRPNSQTNGNNRGVYVNKEENNKQNNSTNDYVTDISAANTTTATNISNDTTTNTTANTKIVPASATARPIASAVAGNINSSATNYHRKRAKILRDLSRSNVFDLDQRQVEDMDEAAAKNRLVECMAVGRALQSQLLESNNRLNRLEIKNKMLLIDASEALQRHEVELNINRRETDRLLMESNGHHYGATTNSMLECDNCKKIQKRTKQKIRDLNLRLEQSDAEVFRLRQELFRQSGQPGAAHLGPALPSSLAPALPAPPPPPPQGYGHGYPYPSQQRSDIERAYSSMYSANATNDNRPTLPPPTRTQPQQPPAPQDQRSSQDLTALEMLANHVLSHGRDRETPGYLSAPSSTAVGPASGAGGGVGPGPAGAGAGGLGPPASVGSGTAGGQPASAPYLMSPLDLSNLSSPNPRQRRESSASTITLPSDEEKRTVSMA